MSFSFETTDYVCESCGGADWHDTKYFLNSTKQWYDDSTWCATCETDTNLVEADDYEGDDD